MSDLPPPLPGQPSTNWERATLEKLVLASINEQRAARRWKMGMRLAWLAFFALTVWLLFQRAPAPGVHAARIEPHTAVVDVQGMIADNYD